MKVYIYIPQLWSTSLPVHQMKKRGETNKEQHKRNIHKNIEELQQKTRLKWSVENYWSHDQFCSQNLTLHFDTAPYYKY